MTAKTGNLRLERIDSPWESNRMRCAILILFALFCTCLPCNRLSLIAAERSADADLIQLKQSVVLTYANLASATYEDSLNATKKLGSAIHSFLATPSQETLEAARSAWRQARVFYCQTEAFRFYDGPIDQIDGLVNAWPIDENYIDYVFENPEAGIINDPKKYPVLTKELLLSLNEKEGKKNISTGFHAIEFLLWGQDRSTTQAGDRSWRDYLSGVKNAGRRGTYLRITTDLLVEHLTTLTEAWSEKKDGKYRSHFVAEPDAALGKILHGLGALSGPELAGERLTVPYETKEQEDEHSCFSDNTRDDILNDAIGIANVFFGRYTRAGGGNLAGPSMSDLLKKIDPEFADKLSDQIESSVSAAQGIPQPFDQAILDTNRSPGRIAIKKAIVAFQTTSDMFAHAIKIFRVSAEPQIQSVGK